MGYSLSVRILLLVVASTWLSCHVKAMSMVVVHVASGTRDILVFWAAWPRL
jgi:hypothetical protein